MRSLASAARWMTALVCLGYLYLASADRARSRPAPPPDQPWQHTLDATDEKRVAALQGRIEKLEEAGQFAQAHDAAREVVAIRARAQGADHWETNLARRVAAALPAK